MLGLAVSELTLGVLVLGDQQYANRWRHVDGGLPLVLAVLLDGLRGDGNEQRQ